MTPRPTIRLLLLALAAASAAAQTVDPAIPPTVPRPVRHRTPRSSSAPVGPNLDVILLDPAHGRQDPGAKLGPNLLEKDANLDFARRLRTVLAARGFNVVLTRENDPVPQAPTPNPDPTLPPIPAPQPSPLTADSRAELANRTHPLACLLLHTTATGRGVHLYTSALSPVTSNPAASSLSDALKPIQLWDTAQATVLPQSLQLAGNLSQSIRNLGIPVLSGSASVSPVDAMPCAAVIVELAPLSPNGGNLTPAGDPGYQSRVADAILQALTLWHSQVAARIAAQTPTKPATVPPVTTSPKPRAKPKPAVTSPDAATAKPAAKPAGGPQ